MMIMMLIIVLLVHKTLSGFAGESVCLKGSSAALLRVRARYGGACREDLHREAERAAVEWHAIMLCGRGSRQHQRFCLLSRLGRLRGCLLPYGAALAGDAWHASRPAHALLTVVTHCAHTQHAGAASCGVVRALHAAGRQCAAREAHRRLSCVSLYEKRCMRWCFVFVGL